MALKYWFTALLGLLSIALVTGASPALSKGSAIVAAGGGQAPLHVPDMAYYQGLNQNKRVDARWFAQHFTMTQQGFDESYAVKFLRAGGQYAMQYTDPALVSHCSWPAPYVCKGEMATDIHDESAWLHGPDGTRLHVVAYGSKAPDEWQEKLNPASPAVRAAYHAFTARYHGNAIFADDTSGDVNPTEPGKSDYNRYKFGASPAEYCDQDDCKRGEQRYLRDTLGLLESSAHPVFLNTPPRDLTLDLMRQTNKIIGATLESCYRRADDEGAWLREQSFLERVVAMHRYAICLHYPDSDIATDRAFSLASYWVNQDGTYAVIWEQFPRTSGDVALMPEFGVVPTMPLDGNRPTAQRKVGFGLYAREYSRCAQDGTWFGACAAVVNVSALPVPFPQLRGQYHSVMNFSDGGSWYDGATAHWTDGVPRLIGPHSGVILR